MSRRLRTDAGGRTFARRLWWVTLFYFAIGLAVGIAIMLAAVRGFITLPTVTPAEKQRPRFFLPGAYIGPGSSGFYMLGNDADRGRVLCLCDWIGSGPLCEPVDECLLAEGRVVPALPRHHHHHAPSGGTLPLGPSHGGRETDGTVAIGGVRLVGPEYVDQVEELLRVARAQAQLRRDIRHVARAETRREIRRIVNRRAEDIV